MMYYKPTQHEDTITIRRAVPEDADGLRRLAQRDSASLPQGELLIALAGDGIRAAAQLGGTEVVADPFHPTASLVDLLRARAAQLADGDVSRGQASGWRTTGLRFAATSSRRRTGVV